MEAKIIKKYSKFSIAQLKKKATTKFNSFIRKRDEAQRCISCDSPYFTDAGHFYSGGKYPDLKFNENNVHGQCKTCNYNLDANINEYRLRLENKIGSEKLEELDFLAKRSKQTGYKWDRIFLIEIIEKYK